MATTEPPLCVASNSDSVFLATLDDSQAYRSRPPAVVIYKSQKNPTSLASIQWTSLSSILVNGPIPGVLPFDSNGYWCAADDSGAFVIISGAKNTNSWSSNPYSVGHSNGLLYIPPPPTNPNSGGGTIGGPAAGVGFSNVITNGYYPCIDNSGQCSGYLYALPSATAGAPSNFVLAMYNSSGYSLEVLDRTTKKFTTLVDISVSAATSSPNAFGYTNNKLVTLTPPGGQAISLNSQGLPPQGNGTSSSANLDASVMSECGVIKRGMYANGSTITKLATVTERTDAALQGVIPVPGPNGGASTWALAYSTQAGGLYDLMMSGSWEDQKAASTKAGIIGGVCAAIAVVLGVAGFFYWRRKKQQREARKAEEPQYPGTKLEPLDGNTLPPPPPPGNNQVSGFSSAPILESPLPSLPPDSQGQPQHQSQPYPSQYPQQFSQSYPQQFPQQFPQQYSQQQFSQQFPQQGPHPGQPNPIFNTTQPIPSASSQSFSALTQPSYQQQPSPSTTTTSTPTAATNAPSFNANANSAQQLQDIQFSTHPRPNFTTMADGGNS
ncbi:hypothetical protein KI688_003061 [Linnemannia hyalina]|uniref:Uncharacterized protein n=1 Tax=Linnemannia hyalina TaxID=64524 RepID=A0A9P7XPP8_9FUNG|nr:hypothetical protein KI688_003061 [Linnemannia hyalina]